MSPPVDKRVREAIVRAFHEERRGYDDIARLLGVGRATVSRVLRLFRETDGVERRPAGGGNHSPLTGSVAKALRGLLDEMPDATIAELVVSLTSRTSVETSRSSVQRALHRWGYSRKKSPSSPPSATVRSGKPIAANSAPR